MFESNSRDNVLFLDQAVTQLVPEQTQFLTAQSFSRRAYLVTNN